MSTGALEALCDHYGIASEYEDIWGAQHPVAEETRQALLGAMGVAADSESAAEASLRAAEERIWRRHLPPVQVAREDAGQLEVALYLPQSRANATIAWRLEEEGGTTRDGQLSAEDLPPCEQREIGGETWLRCILSVEPPSAIGYHRFTVEGVADEPASMSLVVAPAQCYRPQAVADDRRVWGLGAQLYGIRSARNWGTGDFTDVFRLLAFAADAGAGMLGLSPLHALFPHNPTHASPYSPSSRRFLNPLYLDIEIIPELAECGSAQALIADEAFQAELRALRSTELVDYGAVARVKRAVLEPLYQHFRQHHLDADSERGRAFHAFQSAEGEALRRHALHETLQEALHQSDEKCWGWPVWPEAYRDIDSSAVVEFATAHGERIEFFEYLQWLAHDQLAAAGRRAAELGLGVGIYQDVAVGCDVGGAEVWANPELFATAARIGAPPDDFSRKGQDWGLPPWIPSELREQAYEPFIAVLRSGMAQAGALRIDHVMALYRLYWIPPGAASAAEGDYVHYPFQDLLGILALESQRNRCLVIGEDLGTVPEEVREGLSGIGVLSYRLLYFEKDESGAFQPPSHYPADALVAVTTHDLPTLAGFWSGIDLELRRNLELFPDQQVYESLVVRRAEERARVLLALTREGLLPPEGHVNPAVYPEMTPELAAAVHRYLARAPSRCAMAQLEDLFGQTEQVNLPGSIDEYPNWRRKLPLELEHWTEDPGVEVILDALRGERGRAVTALLPVERPGLPRQAEIPRGTYRLQLNAGFTFADAAALVPYLTQLGVSHCYCSPYLKARPGSTHGYDIIDHEALNPELGDEAAFEAFCDTLRDHGMGQILDVVPNHMGVLGADNRWWLQVLENGQASPYAEFFDIDWVPLKDELRGKVLLPVLGDHYGAVLERGELVLKFDASTGEFSVHYYEHRFPIDPREYPAILGRRLSELEARLGPGDSVLLEFQSLLTAFGNLPPRSATEPESKANRERDKEIHKRRLATLCHEDADLAHFVEHALDEYNGRPDLPADPGLLHGLLEAQAYRLAFWRVAGDQINYRRFFDINELAGLRMERDEVFEATHALVLDLVAQRKVQGLRIDHPDGLYDPRKYFEQVQAAVAALVVAAPDEPPDPKPVYLVIEKILGEGERLPADWPVHGTTGYQFSDLIGGLFVDPAGAGALARIYGDFIDALPDLKETIYQAKHLVMREALASELNVLARNMARIAEADAHTRDFTEESLRRAIAEVVACFPVYRTYITGDAPTEAERGYIEQAVEEARRRSRWDAPVFDFLRQVLLTTIADGKPESYRQRVLSVAMHFQQYTGPVTAKGVEDTAFYRYHRLVSLNEVGGEPERFGVSPGELHELSVDRQARWPHAMHATSTHDCKRSEDLRARLHLLSELPAAWAEQASRWAELNEPLKTARGGALWPDSNTEYLLYQTLLGAWPLDELDDEAPSATLIERFQNYMVKAVREAKAHTSWTNPDPDYESALHQFIAALLHPETGRGFRAEFLPFQRQLARLGLFNALSQALLKLTLPGVPDIYQGTELWDFSLVDPDNRRPVDYDHRRAQLASLRQDFAPGADWTASARMLSESLTDGRAKLLVTWRALALRRTHPALFQHGDHVPLRVLGAHAVNVFAFARRLGDDVVLTAVPRLVGRHLGTPTGPGYWRDTRVELPPELEAASVFDVFTGAELSVNIADGNGAIPISTWLAHFPAGLAASRALLEELEAAS